MGNAIWYTLILLIGVLAAPGVMAAGNTVPLKGAVFLGEQGLDITATGAVAGSQIVYYGPGGSPASVPVATLTVDNPSDFYISPALFGDKTGPWFIIPANSLAFYVQDPITGLRVIDETRDFQVTEGVTWIPKGDAVGFRIDTNVYEIAKRPGSPGAPITIRIRGPGGVEYSSLDGYQLEDIMIATSPFVTGGVWLTGDYESGTYTAWAESTGNDMNINYKREGKTVTAPVEFLVQSTNPLITTEPTTSPATIRTTSPATTPTAPPLTTVMTPVPTTVVTTLPATETPVPTTTAPGFSTLLSLSALGVLVFIVNRK